MPIVFLTRNENRTGFAGLVPGQPRCRLYPLSIFLLLIASSLIGSAQETSDLTQMSLEDLLKLDVATTVGKRTQKLSRTAAAVYVINREEMERSGLTSVPEILRLAPGVEVARVNSSTWAISIRGFNGTLSNKLLVLVDGRTVYSSLFTQVFWAVQDLSLDEIERIEVVRGPGAAIWGANAVNGVINIVTRNANDTQGRKLTLQSGNYDQAVADARYGEKFANGVAYRISSRYALRGQIDAPGDSSLHDRWDLQSVKVQGDWDRPSDTFTVSGSLYNVGAGETVIEPSLDPPSHPAVNTATTYGGGSGLIRWEHKTEQNTNTVFQIYFDRSRQDRRFAGTTDNTLDLDFHEEHHIGRNDLLWGLGFRYIREGTIPSFALTFDPRDQTIKLFSAFAQNEIEVVSNQLWLTVGTKLEHNQYTGMEWQPDLRLLWSATRQHSFWVAASRAVRTPAAFEIRGRANVAVFRGPGGVPTVTSIFGSAARVSETVLAYEAGYRLQASHNLSFDLTWFVDLYRHLSGGTQGATFMEANPAPAHLVVPVFTNNRFRGRGEGAELSFKYSATARWDLNGSWSWLTLSQHPDPPGTRVLTIFDTGASPSQQFQLHSYLTLPRHVQFDCSAYFVSHLSATQVPAHTRLDVHLGWSATETLNLSAGLQNLLRPHHAEFVETVLSAVPEEVTRSFYGKLEWKF